MSPHQHKLRYGYTGLSWNTKDILFTSISQDIRKDSGALSQGPGTKAKCYSETRCYHLFHSGSSKSCRSSLPGIRGEDQYIYFFLYHHITHGRANSLRQGYWWVKVLRLIFYLKKIFFLNFLAALCTMEDLSSPTRLNLCHLHWEFEVLTTGPPGKLPSQAHLCLPNILIPNLWDPLLPRQWSHLSIIYPWHFKWY